MIRARDASLGRRDAARNELGDLEKRVSMEAPQDPRNPLGRTETVERGIDDAQVCARFLAGVLPGLRHQRSMALEGSVEAQEPPEMLATQALVDAMHRLNLQANANAEVQVRGRRVAVHAAVVSDAEHAAIWPDARRYNDHWRQYAENTKRTIPLVLLRPR